MRKIIVLLICVCLLSCGLRPISRKGFTIYKEAISNNTNASKIRTDGIYVDIKYPDNQSVCCVRYYIFYENGYALVGSVNKGFWQKPIETISEEFKNKFSDLNDLNYGVYKVSNDSITVNWFVGDNQSHIYKMWVIEYNLEIINDTIIQVNSNYDFIEKNNSYDKPVILKFYTINNVPKYKPISWYLKKKWYQEGLHESRR